MESYSAFPSVEEQSDAEEGNLSCFWIIKKLAVPGQNMKYIVIIVPKRLGSLDQKHPIWPDPRHSRHGETPVI